MTDEELVKDFAAKVSKGEITFDKVRPQLEQLGIEEARVKQIVRRVDDEVQAALVSKSTATSPQSVIRIGILLVVIGGAVILGSLAGFFSIGSQYFSVMAYAPIIAGLVMIFVAIRRKNKDNTGSGSEPSNRKFQIRDRTKD